MQNSLNTLLNTMTTEEKVALLSGSGLWRTKAFEHLGLGDIVMTDGTYGVRYSKAQIEQGADWCVDDFLNVVNQQADSKGGSEAYFGFSEPATCFPNGSSVGCSWDIDLLEEMGQALAVECQHYGVDILLGPGINIRRTPLAGRGYEYYAEDPVLSGDLAAGLINGLQEQGVGASLKHFACNNSEYKRTEMDSVVDERALREIYLSGFKRAIDKSQPWTVMSSYNRLNGIQTSHNPWLLNTVLREEWGYPGVVMSDWYGIKNRPASLLAGNDLAMPESHRDKASLLAAVQNGEVSEQTLNTACERMLALIDKARSGRQKDTRADFAAHHQLAQRIAADSLVLLKNDTDLLPLEIGAVQHIAVLGLPAQIPVIQGSGCATTRPYLLDCPLDEIVDIAGDNFTVEYAAGMGNDNQDDEKALAQAVQLAAKSDVAVVFASTAVGEDGENGDRENLDILPAHQKLIEAVAEVQPNLVVVLANSDAVVMPWARKTRAILETFFAGQGMGRAVAEALFGLVNPSGKLTVSVPNTLEETPAYLSYPGENNRHLYSEGIYVGYRYYDNRRQEPLFPFGFGLSYTQFSYSNITASRSTLPEGESVTVTLDVTNTGKRAGKEIVQLYLSAPQGPYCREVQALKGFAKVALAPGETKPVSMTLDWDDFCYFNPQAKKWLAFPGSHTLTVARSSRQPELTVDIMLQPEPYYPPLQIDSSLVDLLANPDATTRIVRLVQAKSQMAEEEVREKLTAIAPDMFCGMAVTFNEMLGLDISDDELALALDEEQS